MNIIENLTIVDFVFFVLSVLLIFRAVLKGVLKELVRVFGVLCGTLLAFQYYDSLAQKIGEKALFLNKEYFVLISFFSLYCFGTFVFFILGSVIGAFIKKKEYFVPERIVALFIGTGHAFFLVSVIIFMLFLSPMDPKKFSSSLAFRTLKNVAPGIYLGTITLYNKGKGKLEVNQEVVRYYEAKDVVSRNDKKRD